MRAGMIILIALILIVISNTLYVVNEYEQVIITQFGKPVGDPVTTPGLKIKTPFIQKANFFDKRFLEWDGEPNEVPTKDKRFIYVDTYARWRITDPLLFFQRLRDERGAQSRLDDILDGETRNTIAKHNLIEVVRSTNREFEVSSALEDQEIRQITAGRIALEQEVLTNASERTKVLGIEILDFQFQLTDAPPCPDEPGCPFPQRLDNSERELLRVQQEFFGRSFRWRQFVPVPGAEVVEFAQLFPDHLDIDAGRRLVSLLLELNVPADSEGLECKNCLVTRYFRLEPTDPSWMECHESLMISSGCSDRTGSSACNHIWSRECERHRMTFRGSKNASRWSNQCFTCCLPINTIHID